MLKKITAALLAAALVSACLTACTNGENSSSAVSSAEQQSGAVSSAVLTPVQAAQSGTAVSVCIGPEPVSLDPALSDGSDTDSYCAAAFEGLYKIDKNGKIVLGQAASAAQSSDKKTWTFTLRKDAKWSDGQPVKASDFVYAWKRNVKLSGAKGVSAFMYLKNGTELLDGKVSDAGLLGVTANGDSKLIVTLSTQCPQLPQLLTRPIFMPLRSDKVKDGWAGSTGSLVGNGPMKMKQWNVKTNIVFEKSDTYYDKAEVTAAKLDCTLSEDDDARLSAYDNNEISFISPLPVKYYERLRERGDFSAAASDTAVCLLFNTQNNDVSLSGIRSALSLAADRDALARESAGVKFTPASGYVPEGTEDAGGKNDFREVGGELFKTGEDAHAENVKKAKAMLDAAGFKDGKNFPKLTITVPISTLYVKTANAVAAQWKKDLGINCTVSQLPYKQFRENCEKGSVQITIGSVAAASDDPLDVLTQYIDPGTVGVTNWKKGFVTEYLKKARSCAPQSAERFSALHMAEKRLQQQCPVSPLFFAPSLSLKDTKLNGIFTVKSGTTYFAYANRFNS